MIELFLEKKEFFFDLLLEHIKISAVSILIAIMIGLFIGILISEYKKTSKLTLSVISFLYTIPSISMLGFLIPFTGVGNTTAIFPWASGCGAVLPALPEWRQSGLSRAAGR